MSGRTLKSCSSCRVVARFCSKRTVASGFGCSNPAKRVATGSFPVRVATIVHSESCVAALWEAPQRTPFYPLRRARVPLAGSNPFHLRELKKQAHFCTCSIPSGGGGGIPCLRCADPEGPRAGARPNALRTAHCALRRARVPLAGSNPFHLRELKKQAHFCTCSIPSGGGGGIRTLVTWITGKTVFETAAFNHSATPPWVSAPVFVSRICLSAARWACALSY